MHQLQGLTKVGELERGAQERMSFNQTFCRMPELIAIESCLNAITEHVMIHCGKRVQLIVEKHTQLQPAQWVCVFNALRQLRPVARRDQAERLAGAKSSPAFRSLRILCQGGYCGVFQNVFQPEPPAALLRVSKDDDATN